MGIATENVKGIIAAAHPNANLIHKANEKQEIAAQQAKEQRFYDKITMVDPVTKQPIKTIHQLNELILHMDQLYNLGALLPHGSINGGAVERILSNQPYNYNLKLRGHNKFTESEQARIKTELQSFANLALDRITKDPTLNTEFQKAGEAQALRMIFAAMSAININTGNLLIFMTKASASDFKNNIFSRMLESGQPLRALTVKQVRISEKIVGSGRTKNKTNSGMMEGVRVTKDYSGRGAERVYNQVIFDPNLNNLSEAAFNDLYTYAAEKNLLDPQLQLQGSNELGSGEISPMDVPLTKWRNDVYEAVKYALSGDGTNPNLIPRDELEQLFNQYDIYNNIALGRSLSNLRGFTGELRAILITHLLFPGGSSSLLGKAKVTLENSVRSEDAPIDVLVSLLNEAFGIQVKNISDLESYSWGNFRDSGGMSIPGFYGERLQSSMDGSEKNFFGAYVYNQPVSNYPNPYEAVYGGFQSAFEGKFVPVYKKLALYIIRQITKVKSSNNPILSGTITNDFFFMNNKIVPASAFMSAMSDGSNMITSSFTLVKAPYPGYYRSGAKQPADYGSYTNQANIRYSIDVQFARLLTSAYNGI